MGNGSLPFCSGGGFGNIFAGGSALLARGHDLKG